MTTQKNHRQSVKKYKGFKVGDVVYVEDIDGTKQLVKVTCISKYSIFAKPEYAGMAVIHHMPIYSSFLKMHTGTWSEQVFKCPRSLRASLKRSIKMSSKSRRKYLQNYPS